METEAMLAETIDSARRRECENFDAAEVGRGLVLFGAGSLGRKVLAALRRDGIEPLAFADNNADLHGTRIEGLDVLSLAAAAARWGSEARFVATIFQPTGGGLPARLAELERAGCRSISSFLPLAWSYPGALPHFAVDLPSRLLEYAEPLRRVAAAWHDEASREVFRAQLAWRLRNDFGCLAPPTPGQYFPTGLLKPDPEEVFVDGGAFDGDTLRAMPWDCFRAIAFEPDPTNAARLAKNAGRSVEIHRALLGGEAGRARFHAAGTMASARTPAGDLDVPVMTLDGALAGIRPTYLKLDVEGDELAALRGGRGLLARHRPAVAVCVYHRPEDLWTIPLFLREVLPEHRLFLRAHADDGFELVAYALPPHRCA